MTGQVDRERSSSFVGTATLVENKGNGGSPRCFALKSFANGGPQLSGSIQIQEIQQFGGLTAGGLSAREGGIEQGLAFGNSLGKPAAAGGTQSLAFFFQQLFLVCRIENLLPSVIGAAMPGNLLAAVENADRGF